MPMTWLRPVTRARAAMFGREPSSVIAARTRARVALRTFGWLLSTRDTVWCETPASLATSVIAGGLEAPFDEPIVDAPFTPSAGVRARQDRTSRYSDAPARSPGPGRSRTRWRGAPADRGLYAHEAQRKSPGTPLWEVGLEFPPRKEGFWNEKRRAVAGGGAENRPAPPGGRLPADHHRRDRLQFVGVADP